MELYKFYTMKIKTVFQTHMEGGVCLSIRKLISTILRLH